MTDWEVARIFGTPNNRLPVVVRPSAYAIVCDSFGRLAVVRVGAGVYLPGGGSGPAEHPDATIRREALEECGLVLELGAWRRFAIEYVVAPREGASFEKRSTFCGATLLGTNGNAIELDHVLVWLAPSEALGALTPQSHRWAVSEWLADPAANAATARPVDER